MTLKRRLRLARIPDAFLPAALLAASAMRPQSRLPLYLFAACLAVQLLSLFASRGVRIAFARQPAIRHVRGSVKSSLLLTLLGGALASLTAWLVPAAREVGAVPLAVAGCLLNIEHIFYEYLYAIGDDNSATLSRGLTALFTLAGLLLAPDAVKTPGPQWILGMSGLSALVALVISLVMGDGTKGRPNGEVLRCAPRAALQTVLYPAAGYAALRLIRFDPVAAPLFAGLILYELCKTPFRRSPMEARGFHRVLLIACGSAALAWAGFAILGTKATLPPLLNAVPTACAMVILAAICAFALFGNVKRNDE